MEQEILELSQPEREWLARNLALVRDLVQGFAGKEEPRWLVPANLDQGYRSWHSVHKRGKEDPNPVINAFGIAFGQYLIDSLGLEWKLAKDKDSTELVVHGAVGEILLFPTNLVAKRYVSGQLDFFLPLSQSISEEVNRIRGLHAG
jgi:hypothetical protein